MPFDVSTPRPLTRRMRPLGRAGRDLELHRVAAERGHLDGRAERRLGERDRHVHAEVQAVALEHRMLAHVDGEDEVARLTAIG